MLYRKYAPFCQKMLHDLRITDDGSHTIYNNEIGECYHSVHGAVVESKHVFVKSGFCEILKPYVSVFEVGFGTGLNALLTLEHALNQGKSVRYITTELYPLSPNIYKALNYGSTLLEREHFLCLHAAQWEQEVLINPNFSLKKQKVDFTKMVLSEPIDLVYFDAFSPEKQPEMWTEMQFSKLYERMNEGGLLVTYCAKGVVRRTLQSVGFTVERIQGPVGGKREILRARK